MKDSHITMNILAYYFAPSLCTITDLHLKSTVSSSEEIQRVNSPIPKSIWQSNKIIEFEFGF